MTDQHDADLVKRLHEYQAYCPQTDRSNHPICTEAASRIEALEAAMRNIINQGQMFPYSATAFRKIQAIAHKALKDKP